MKSEERHHLKENDLQNLLVKAKPFLEKNSSMIIAVILAIVVAGVAYLWMNRPPSEATSKAASGMLTASSQQDYADIAADSQFAGTLVAHWATLKEAEMQLSSGTTMLFSDRAGAVSDLKQALKNYEEVLAKTDDPELQELALYGKACTLEVLSEGDTSEAIKAFETFLTRYDKISVYSADAKKRIERLKKPGVQSLYKWMAANAGKPLEERLPQDGQMSSPLDGILSPEGGAPAGESPLGPLLNPAPEGEAKPAPETPAEPAGEEKAGEEKPGEEPAAEETSPSEPESASEEPAAEEKPAESPPSE
ncbi:MAG: hypothetical protein KDA65_09710 [Planctomycetaceae bacterium]|nr:hypothetical protein [Planctomycetaceae bacterium]